MNSIDRREFLKRLGMTMGSAATMIALEPLRAWAGDEKKPQVATADNRMTYRVQHGSGENISLLGLGMMRMPRNDQALVNRIVDYALAHGINYFDTAPMYGGGRNEGITGEALSRYPRERYYVATKMSNYDERTWSFEESKKIYEKSFRELRVDYIDYYLLHGIGLGGMHDFEGRFINNGFLDFLLTSTTAVAVTEEVTEELLERVAHRHRLPLGILRHLNIYNAIHRPLGGGRQIHQSTRGSRSRSCSCSWRISGYCRRCH